MKNFNVIQDVLNYEHSDLNTEYSSPWSSHMVQHSWLNYSNLLMIVCRVPGNIQHLLHMDSQLQNKTMDLSLNFLKVFVCWTEPLVPSVSDFGCLCPCVSKSGLIHHCLYSSFVACVQWSPESALVATTRHQRIAYL